MIPLMSNLKSSGIGPSPISDEYFDMLNYLFFMCFIIIIFCSVYHTQVHGLSKTQTYGQVAQAILVRSRQTTLNL